LSRKVFMRFFIMYMIISKLFFYAESNNNENGVMTNEMKAIAACESGNLVDLNSRDWNAINVNDNKTIDTGAFQFNSYWIWNSSNTWIMKHVIKDLGMDTRSFFKEYPTARHAPPSIQIATFEYLWNNGYGWKNWKASQSCWSQWLIINEEGRAVWKD
jgi:hypothetical protein